MQVIENSIIGSFNERQEQKFGAKAIVAVNREKRWILSTIFRYVYNWESAG